MMKVFFFIFISFSLFSQEKIQLVADFCIDIRGLNETIAQYSPNLQFEMSDLSEYSSSLKKKNSFWKNLLTSLYPNSISLKKGISKIVFWNINSKLIHKYNLNKLPKEKLILFLWEPPTVLKKMHKKKVLALFSKIFTWNDELVDNKTYFKFYYPVLSPMIEQIPSFEEKKLCTMFCSNLKSSFPNELYSERKKAIEYFETLEEDVFDFYGKGWEENTYKNHRGWVLDKTSAQKNYKFLICYENSGALSGYITEKIFDCFSSGVVPIYWGASNIEQYVPKDCFIDRRNFSSIEEVYLYIKKMNKEEYQGYIDRIRTFLSSDQAKLFSQENFIKILIETLEKN